jgi:hypothetical protein
MQTPGTTQGKLYDVKCRWCGKIFATDNASVRYHNLCKDLNHYVESMVYKMEHREELNAKRRLWQRQVYVPYVEELKQLHPDKLLILAGYYDRGQKKG